MPWQVDVLGSGHEQQVLELGRDPDGERARRAGQTAHYISDLALYDVLVAGW